MADEAKVTGRCNCSRYTITIPKPTVMNLCHCTDCRRWAGAFHSAHVFAEDKDAIVKGPEPRTFQVTGIKGKQMTRAWCDNCGSGLWIRASSAEGKTFFKAGKSSKANVLCSCLFDPGTLPAPTLETFTKDMEPWERTSDTTEKWEANFGGI